MSSKKVTRDVLEELLFLLETNTIRKSHLEYILTLYGNQREEKKIFESKSNRKYFERLLKNKKLYKKIKTSNIKHEYKERFLLYCNDNKSEIISLKAVSSLIKTEKQSDLYLKVLPEILYLLNGGEENISKWFGIRCSLSLFFYDQPDMEYCQSLNRLINELYAKSNKNIKLILLIMITLNEAIYMLRIRSRNKVDSSENMTNFIQKFNNYNYFTKTRNKSRTGSVSSINSKNSNSSKKKDKYSEQVEIFKMLFSMYTHEYFEALKNNISVNIEGLLDGKEGCLEIINNCIYKMITNHDSLIKNQILYFKPQLYYYLNLIYFFVDIRLSNKRIAINQFLDVFYKVDNCFPKIEKILSNKKYKNIYQTFMKFFNDFCRNKYDTQKEKESQSYKFIILILDRIIIIFNKYYMALHKKDNVDHEMDGMSDDDDNQKMDIIDLVKDINIMIPFGEDLKEFVKNPSYFEKGLKMYFNFMEEFDSNNHFIYNLYESFFEKIKEFLKSKENDYTKLDKYCVDQISKFFKYYMDKNIIFNEDKHKKLKNDFPLLIDILIHNNINMEYDDILSKIFSYFRDKKNDYFHFILNKINYSIFINHSYYSQNNDLKFHYFVLYYTKHYHLKKLLFSINDLSNFAYTKNDYYSNCLLTFAQILYISKNERNLYKNNTCNNEILFELFELFDTMDNNYKLSKQNYLKQISNNNSGIKTVIYDKKYKTYLEDIKIDKLSIPKNINSFIDLITNFNNTYNAIDYYSTDYCNEKDLNDALFKFYYNKAPKSILFVSTKLKNQNDFPYYLNILNKDYFTILGIIKDNKDKLITYFYNYKNELWYSCQDKKYISKKNIGNIYDRDIILVYQLYDFYRRNQINKFLESNYLDFSKIDSNLFNHLIDLFKITGFEDKINEKFIPFILKDNNLEIFQKYATEYEGDEKIFRQEHINLINKIFQLKK